MESEQTAQEQPQALVTIDDKACSADKDCEDTIKRPAEEEEEPEQVAKVAKKPVIRMTIGIEGPLGSGKTSLAKAAMNTPIPNLKTKEIPYSEKLKEFVYNQSKLETPCEDYMGNDIKKIMISKKEEGTSVAATEKIIIQYNNARAMFEKQISSELTTPKQPHEITNISDYAAYLAKICDDVFEFGDSAFELPQDRPSEPKPITFGRALQLIGTEVFRNHCNDFFWILLAKYQAQQFFDSLPSDADALVIHPDVRTREEAWMDKTNPIQESSDEILKFQLWRIERNPEEEKEAISGRDLNHASETSMKGYKSNADNMYRNVGTLEDLENWGHKKVTDLYNMEAPTA